MKKIWKTICIAICIAVLATVFVGCKREEEQIDEGIVVAFVTGFESDNLIVNPVVVTEKTPGTMPEDPKYAGYEFTGWYYDKACTQKFSTSDVLKTNTVLYAGWNKKRSDGSAGGEEEKVVAPNGLAYTRIDGEYVVTGYSGTDKEITVPVSYMGYAVTAFGENAFGTNDTVETINFSDGVKKIDGTAFTGLRALKDVNVTSSDVFRSVNGVLFNRAANKLLLVGRGRTAAFTIPANVTEVGENAFYGCTFSVTIPESGDLTVLDGYSFAGFRGELKLGSKVAEIRKRAFEDATCSILFPTTCAITKLGNGEFDGYKGERLVLPGSIEKMSGSPFYGATAALDLTATGLKTLGPSALAGYAGNTFVVPYFVEEIEENCFFRCTAKVTFDERSTYACVKELAFNQFAGEVVLPATVKTVEKNAFYAATHATVRFSTRRADVAIDEKAFNLCKEKDIVSYAE